MAAHLIRFLMYNFIGALLPLFISLFIRNIANITHRPGVYTPELLFFSIMISATALGDVTDEIKLYKKTIFQLIKGALIFGSIGAAIIFGMFQYDAIVGPGNIGFRENITKYSLTIAVFLFITSFMAEFLVAKINGNPK
jgi:NO-binding membrane sensor protein with MHYT domain